MAPGSNNTPARLQLAYGPLLAIFSIEAVILTLVQLPESLSFDRFAFLDRGANLTIQYLVEHGYRPSIDFGYHYGLLGIFIGDIWLHVFGLTPLAYQLAMVVSDLIMVWGIARFCRSLAITAAGLVLLTITMPFAVLPTYWSFAHAIEALLLCNALAEQAAGRLDIALALVTTACFAKPSMGYFYGLVLLVLMAFRASFRIKENGARLLKELLPAALTAVVLAFLLGSVYGLKPLMNTLLPLTGAKAYAASHYGFFRGEGRHFWFFPGVRWGYYFGTVAGFWILATVWLILAASYSVVKPVTVRNYEDAKSRTVAIVLTCVLLHVTFVCVFFGHAGSWTYYFYVLAMGTAAASSHTSKMGQKAAWVLAAFAVLGLKSTVTSTYQLWMTTRPRAQMSELWTSNAEADEWEYVRKLEAGRKAVLLSYDGCADLLFPEFQRPITVWIHPGLTTADELNRKVSQVSSARWLVLPLLHPVYDTFLADWPQLSNALNGSRIVWRGKFFEVLERPLTSGRRGVDGAKACMSRLR